MLIVTQKQWEAYHNNVPQHLKHPQLRDATLLPLVRLTRGRLLYFLLPAHNLSPYTGVEHMFTDNGSSYGDVTSFFLRYYALEKELREHGVYLNGERARLQGVCLATGTVLPTTEFTTESNIRAAEDALAKSQDDLEKFYGGHSAYSSLLQFLRNSCDDTVEELRKMSENIIVDDDSVEEAVLRTSSEFAEILARLPTPSIPSPLRKRIEQYAANKSTWGCFKGAATSFIQQWRPNLDATSELSKFRDQNDYAPDEDTQFRARFEHFVRNYDEAPRAAKRPRYTLY